MQDTMISGLSLKPSPSLDTLPSELRRLIVSHLAPHPDDHRPGSKEDLKNANASHSCLREWTPEYLFRDMALNHVLVGMSSQLERFTNEPSNGNLLEFVKHIRVQVPPALRWEIGQEDEAFGQGPDMVTVRRLCAKFRVQDQRQMTDDQLEYCNEYYRALVEPFTDARTWYRLQRAATPIWRHIFRRFTNLTEISVGCCQIADHPLPTSTGTFVFQHGRDVFEEPDPPFVRDESVNMAWASSLVIRMAPEYVQHLRLSMANLDNFNSFATVNRLQNLSYRKPLDHQVLNLTHLTLNIQGIPGTHGSKDWMGETGSAGAVKHWKGMLNSIKKLQHLELRDAMMADGEIFFSDMELSDENECILDWLLPGLELVQLRSLHLSGFILDVATIREALSGHWPLLEKLTLSKIQLLNRGKSLDFFGDKAILHHIFGKGWLDTCRTLHHYHPEWCIILDHPITLADGLEDNQIARKYVKLLNEIPNIRLVNFKVVSEDDISDTEDEMNED